MVRDSDDDLVQEAVAVRLDGHTPREEALPDTADLVEGAELPERVAAVASVESGGVTRVFGELVRGAEAWARTISVQTELHRVASRDCRSWPGQRPERRSQSRGRIWRAARRPGTLDGMRHLAALLLVSVFGCKSPTAEPIALFNGHDLAGWTLDVPDADGGAEIDDAFVVEAGNLLSVGGPQGHLVTEESFSNYRLTVEYRWTGEPGNCGVLVHASTPRRLYGMFPQSIECQMHAGNAGDFWCIGEDIAVPNMVERRGPEENWGVDEGNARRVANLTDDSENAPGEWNQMVIECRGDAIDVWVNGDHVNNGTGCTASSGKIALQAEGAACEFRRVELEPLEAS